MSRTPAYAAAALISGIGQRFRQNDIPRLCQHHEQIEQRVLSAWADHKSVALRIGHAWAQPSCRNVTFSGAAPWLAVIEVG
jgi:hypothetical protein